MLKKKNLFNYNHSWKRVLNKVNGDGKKNKQKNARSDAFLPTANWIRGQIDATVSVFVFGF